MGFLADWTVAVVAGVVLAGWLVAVPATVPSAPAAVAVFVFSMLLCLDLDPPAGLSVAAVHPHYLHGSVSTLVVGAADLRHQLVVVASASFHPFHRHPAAAVGLRLFPFSFLDLPYSGNFHSVCSAIMLNDTNCKKKCRRFSSA